MSDGPTKQFLATPPIVDVEVIAKWIESDVNFRVASLNSGFLFLPPMGTGPIEVETATQDDLFEKSESSR